MNKVFEAVFGAWVTLLLAATVIFLTRSFIDWPNWKDPFWSNWASGIGSAAAAVAAVWVVVSQRQSHRRDESQKVGLLLSQAARVFRKLHQLADKGSEVALMAIVQELDELRHLGRQIDLVALSEPDTALVMGLLRSFARVHAVVTTPVSELSLTRIANILKEQIVGLDRASKKSNRPLPPAKNERREDDGD